MKVYIGNAVCDENGKAKGGKPGNQTGKELREQAWYKNSKEWRVFRAKDKNVAAKIAQAMKAACANMNIGYDQSTRNSLYNLAVKVGFDPAKVDTPCNTDCSALVRVCCAYAGVKTPDFNTASEPSRLLATGKFDEMTGEQYSSSPDYLKTGDILVTAIKGHTAVVLNNGSKAGDDPEPTPIDPGKGYVEVIGGSVNVRKGDNALSTTMFVAHKGDKFPYLATAPTGWYQIDTSYGAGYISNKKNLTKLHAEEQQQPIVDSKKYVKVLGGSVNVRKTSNTSGVILGVARRGQKYPLKGIADSGWYQIDFNGKDGYISNKPTLTAIVEA